MRFRLLMLAALCVLLMATYGAGGWSRVFTHVAVNQLCMGVSSGKIFFFLGFTAIFLVRGAFVSTRPRPQTFALLWIPILTGLLASLASWISYVRAFNLDPAIVTMHWAQGVNSINSLTHIHTSKVPIALTLDLLSLHSLHQTFDTGAAYASAVPTWIGAIIGVSFLTSLAISLWLLPAWLRQDPQRRTGDIVLSAFASSAAVKCILDGGPLAYDAFVGLMTLFLLLHGSALGDRLGGLRIRTIPLLAALAWVSAVAILSPGALQGQLTEALKRSLLYFAVSSLSRVSWAGITLSRRQHLGLTGASLCAWACFAAIDVRSRILPLLAPAPAKWLSLRDGPRVVLSGGERVAQVYLRNNDNPLRARYTSVMSRTGLATGMLAEVIPLRATEQVQFQNSPSVRLVRAEVGQDRRIKLQVEFDATLGPVLFADGMRNQVTENERFAAYFAFDGTARRAGLSEYILIPYLQYRDQPSTSAAAE